MAGKAVDPKAIASEKFARLSVYTEKLKQQIAGESEPNKKMALEIDLKKTLKKMDGLRGV